ncbi:MAG: N-acetylglucosaminyl-diphospho-decaprenol L-rhamnosyltransferase [Pseudohongiellaceae bacterium]|jgi:N-acetylglucosaminyl-diphospho-decaprenol L-rhamnosyltransferase
MNSGAAKPREATGEEPFAPPAQEASLSVVVLSWNTRDLLAACLQSLAEARDPDRWQVIVVDNGSADSSADMVAEQFPWAELVRNPVNDGYAIGNNMGAALATGEYLLLLNSDTEVEIGALNTLVSWLAARPTHGVCAPRLVHGNGEVQLSCKRFPTLGTAVFFDTIFEKLFPKNRSIPRYFMSDFDHLSTRDVDQPPGAALLIRRALWEQLSGFDPELWLFFNDVDLCRRVKAAGHLVGYVAEVKILHHEGKSTSQFPDFGTIWHKNRLAYYRKTFGWVGALLARVMTAVRGLQELHRLRSAGAPSEARRAVWRSVKEVWAA